MKTVTSIEELKHWVRQHKVKGSKIGFVPTMGYLHAGHLSLVRKSVSENDVTVTSIFVNPAQFGPNMDLARYPRDLSGDTQKLTDGGVDLLFLPEAAAIYPPGYSTWIDVENLTTLLDGGSRPGYFRGICTVVTKLFHLVEPDRSYFGQKDMQQALVLTKLIQDMNLEIDLQILPTVRESDGLAMSSRNAYLEGADRTIAPELFAALKKAVLLFEGGERNPTRIVDAVRLHLAQFPQFIIDYVDVVDLDQIARVDQVPNPALLALAVTLHGTRLIDNVILGDHQLALPSL